MEKLPARVPRSLFPDLVNTFIPPDTPPDAILELVITIEGENIPAREFAAYLALIDRVYGKLSPWGLRSYAHRNRGRLEIAEIHKSELEIIFRFFYGYADTAAIIVILFFLRSLPQMFKTTSEGIKNLAEAYKSFEEGMTAREDRRRREYMSNDRQAIETGRAEDRMIAVARQLDKKRSSQFTRLLNALIMEEEGNLPAPVRFARRQVRNVILRIREPRPPFGRI
jgi:hypothetical protein